MRNYLLGNVLCGRTDQPQVTLQLGSTLNPDDIKEGDDVYFECHIKANPKENRITWWHDVSIHPNTFWIGYKYNLGTDDTTKCNAQQHRYELYFSTFNFVCGVITAFVSRLSSQLSFVMIHCSIQTIGNIEISSAFVILLNRKSRNTLNEMRNRFCLLNNVSIFVHLVIMNLKPSLIGGNIS